MKKSFSRNDLLHFVPSHETFVGVDSDGCVFDTMETKQKVYFHPLIIKLWGLEAIEPQLRQAAEFVNLYSSRRGQNRFPALLQTFDLLEEWPEVVATGVKLPERQGLRDYCNSGLPLGNKTLIAEAERTGDPGLAKVVEWSLAVNKAIETNMKKIPPFRGVRESFEKIRLRSDLAVVSQTPEQALIKEWEENGLTQFVRIIAGQELGTKAEHLQMLTGGRYRPDKVLMIGDALGDLRAAASVEACFYPINPGHEEASWKRFAEEAYDRFLAGTFRGAYQQKLNAEFELLLPATPPWSRSA
ncbi:MAG TPA: HAD hydrolase-like protein [Pontiellaceae bacterium]|nr:HAD hydrolase-like protein [Pontiellaceae bacterium]